MSLRSGLRQAAFCHASTSKSVLGVRLLSTTSVCASGSNKWSKIKHVKEKNDAKRGSGYSSLSTQIITAVKMHPTRSTSPEHNVKLAFLLKKARAMDVPRDKIEATLKKAETLGSASSDGQMVTYEALGPLADNGLPVALIVECQTDSPGRTHARVKEAFNKHGVRLSSTVHMFQRKGVIRLLTAKDANFDSVFEAAVEQGAEDVREWDEGVVDVDGDHEQATAVEVICDPSELVGISNVLGSTPYSHSIIESQVMMLPEAPPMLVKGVHIPDEQEVSTLGAAGWLSEGDVNKLDKMVDMLYENADCTRIW